VGPPSKFSLTLVVFHDSLALVKKVKFILDKLAWIFQSVSFDTFPKSS